MASASLYCNGFFSGTPFTFPGSFTFALQYVSGGSNICVVDGTFLNQSIIGQYARLCNCTLGNVSSDPDNLNGSGVDALGNNSSGLQIRTSVNSSAPGGSNLVVRVVYQTVPYILA